MNKKIILATLLITLITNVTPELPKKSLPPPTPSLKGCIVSHELDTIPAFKVYYQGIQTVTNDDGFFSIPLENGTIDKISLLVCKDFTPRFESTNTIKHLAISPDKSYQFFSCQKATLPLLQEKITALKEKMKPLTMRITLIEKQTERQKTYLARANEKDTQKKAMYRPAYYEKNIEKLGGRKEKVNAQLETLKTELSQVKEKYLVFQNATKEKPAGDFWFIQKRSLKKRRFSVPDNCVIVCLNPKTVDKVENWNFALSPHFVAIPRIILKTNLETRNVRKKQSITRSALKSEFYSLEQKPFHETRQEEIKVFDGQPNVRVSLLR